MQFENPLGLSKAKRSWRKIESWQSGNKVHFQYVDPEGCKFKSTKDVERKLGMDGTLAQFLTSQTNTTQTVEDSDGDYEPPCKQRAYEDVGKSE